MANIKHRVGLSVSIVSAVLAIAFLHSTNVIATEKQSDFGLNIQGQGTVLPGYYYRFYASYVVDDSEVVDFDMVVACNTAIRSGAGGTSVLSGITPNLFAKRTKNGHAIMVTTPGLCDYVRAGKWELLKNADVIPLTTWFEDASDLTYGLLYASDLAFEIPNNRLRFLRSGFAPASRDEWLKWWSTRPENLISNDMIHPPRWCTEKVSR